MFECKEKVAICGHRGERVHGIENTIAAMKHVVDLGVDMIETDVRMSRDGNLFLMHNKNLADLTNGSGMVSEHTYEELRSMNAAVHASSSETFEAPTFEPIALLEELLELAKNHPDLMLNIELKDMPAENEPFAFECADKIASMLARYGVGNRTWINSFSGSLVQHIYKTYGNTFHYHAFYPWAIMGTMDMDPRSFCDVACLLNWEIDQDGTFDKTRMSVPCSQKWYASLLKDNIMPLTTSFYPDMEDYDKAVLWGSRIIMADDPKKMLNHFRSKGLHS